MAYLKSAEAGPSEWMEKQQSLPILTAEDDQVFATRLNEINQAYKSLLKWADQRRVPDRVKTVMIVAEIDAHLLTHNLCDDAVSDQRLTLQDAKALYFPGIDPAWVEFEQLTKKRRKLRGWVPGE
jgi:hypothetical protein